MINYIFNDIEFVGKNVGEIADGELDVDEIVNNLASDTDKECSFDFNKIDPEPKGLGFGWEEWRLEHWGSTYGPMETKGPLICWGEDCTKVQVYFKTKENPPLPVLVTLSKKHPEITIHCRFFAYAFWEDVYRCGHFTIKGGKVVEQYTPQNDNECIEYRCLYAHNTTPDNCGFIKDSNGNWQKEDN